MRSVSALLICIMMAAILAACGDVPSLEAPVLKVVIQAEGSDTADYQYMSVYNDGNCAKTETFHLNDSAFYTATYGDFHSSVVNNKIVNTLESTVLIDSKGKIIEADEIMTEIMQVAADTINHDIWQFQIIVDEKRYYAFILINVNWQSPSILYQYDAATAKLIELCCWDGVDLVGISTN